MTGVPEYDVLVLIFGQIWAGIVVAFAVLGVASLLAGCVVLIWRPTAPPVPAPWMPPPSPMELLAAEQVRFNRSQLSSDAAGLEAEAAKKKGGKK